MPNEEDYEKDIEKNNDEEGDYDEIMDRENTRDITTIMETEDNEEELDEEPEEHSVTTTLAAPPTSTTEEAEGDEQEGDIPDVELDKTDQEQEKERMRVLLSQFSEEQLKRYESYRRSGFSRTNIKKLMQSVTNSAISQTITIVMAGIAKVYVGELVESARTIMEEWGEEGPVRPKHIREAYRRLKQTGAVPTTKYNKRLFKT